LRKAARQCHLTLRSMTCPEIVLTASYRVWLGSWMMVIQFHSGGVIDGIKETEPGTACSYPCAFSWAVGVHGRQPKRTDTGLGLSSAIRDTESVTRTNPTQPNLRAKINAESHWM